ncbi:MAG: c-type cytochrome [Betaproteobacteria bacterium]|nr:c-type cytochrome [Betaproteobacteria bacterium]
MKVNIVALSIAGAMAFAGGAATAASLSDKSALELMKKAGCSACHSVDKKGVGPAYKDVAKKHKGDKGAVVMLEKKVRSGGAGAYGPIPMPPTAKEKISDKDLHEMIEWVLSR